MAPTYITLTGRPLRVDGRPAKMTVTVTPSTDVRDAAGNTLYPQTPVKVKTVEGELKAVVGGVAEPAQLLATDSPGIVPDSFTYTFTLEAGEAEPTVIEGVQIPANSPGGTIDISDLLPSEAVPAVITWVPLVTYNAKIAELEAQDDALGAAVSDEATTRAAALDEMQANIDIVVDQINGNITGGLATKSDLGHTHEGIGEHTHLLEDITDAGTAAAYDVPEAGNAGPDELVTGGDSRLADARVPAGGAGGVLSGTYPNPGFAVDMVEQSEFQAHLDAPNPHPQYATGAALGAETAARIADDDALGAAVSDEATTRAAALDEMQANIDIVVDQINGNITGGLATKSDLGHTHEGIGEHTHLLEDITDAGAALGAETAARIADDDALEAALDAHTGDTSNPHGVTATQAGADPAGTATGAVAAHVAAPNPHPQYAAQAALDAHTGDTSNPHDVTASQLSDFGPGVNAQVAGLLQPGAGIALDYNAVAGTLEIAATGGGAPVDAPYITTAAHAGLSGEIVIPSLRAHADRAGVLGGDDTTAAGTVLEYNTSVVGLTWDVAPAVIDANTSIKSYLYIMSNTTGSKLGTIPWAPGAGALDIRCKMCATNEVYAGSAIGIAGLYIGDASGGNSVNVHIGYNGGAYADSGIVRVEQSVSGASTSRATARIPLGATAYLRITRTAGGVISCWYSENGLLWQWLNTVTATPTIAMVGHNMFQSSVSPLYVAVDWLRTSV